MDHVTSPGGPVDTMCRLVGATAQIFARGACASISSAAITVLSSTSSFTGASPIIGSTWSSAWSRVCSGGESGPWTYQPPVCSAGGLRQAPLLWKMTRTAAPVRLN